MKSFNGINKLKYKLSSFLVFYCILAINFASVHAGDEMKQELVTIRNDSLRFEVSTPKTWSFSKIEQQDPYEEMRTGLYKSTLSGDDENKKPENWNGFKLISTDTSNLP